MNTDKLISGMKVVVDWLAFTVKVDYMSVQSVIDFLGMDGSMFSPAPRGAQGYKSMLNLDGFRLSILSDGSADMGIHVNIGGSAIGYVLSCYARKNSSVNPFDDEQAFEVENFGQTILTKFLSDVCKIGKVARLDIALDDIGDEVHFTLDDITSYLRQGLVVSKFRTYTNNISKKVSSNELVGGTIYFGSGRSDVRLRIYDKKLEHNAKHPERPVNTSWIRWEFQLRNERAMSAVRLLGDGNSLGMVASGILNNYIRFIVDDDCNRSRCSIAPEWIEFVGSIEKIRLTVQSSPKTLEDKKNWIIEQVLPTLTGIIIADGGSYDIITDHWDSSLMRMKSDMISMVGLALKS